MEISVSYRSLFLQIRSINCCPDSKFTRKRSIPFWKAVRSSSSVILYSWYPVSSNQAFIPHKDSPSDFWQCTTGIHSCSGLTIWMSFATFSYIVLSTMNSNPSHPYQQLNSHDASPHEVWTISIPSQHGLYLETYLQAGSFVSGNYIVHIIFCNLLQVLLDHMIHILILMDQRY